MSDLAFAIGDKKGCLIIIDNGSEFQQKIDFMIESIDEEKEEFIKAVQEGRLERQDYYRFSGNESVTIPAFVYEPQNFQKSCPGPVDTTDFEKAISDLRLKRTITHYKCRCSKCGKIRYYTADTLQFEPKYCFRPIFLSDKSTRSTKSANATFRKRERYEGDESICLINDKSKIIPSEEYCDRWNAEKAIKMKKQAEKDAAIIVSLPRTPAYNYNEDFTGLNYESLEIVECLTDSLEGIPAPHYTQRHQKIYGDVTVYKQYHCRCYLCGKSKDVTCDKFGICPPTPYGYRAYDGYWNNVSCDCHLISSFQWIVNKLLFENHIYYQVEYSFSDLFGIQGKNKLRFDFAIFNKDHSLKCLIECQGKQHYQPVEEFGGEYQYNIQIQNDELKREYVKAHNIPLIEISYKRKSINSIKEVLQNKGIL